MTPTDEKLTEFIAELCRLPEYEGKWEVGLLGRDFVLIDSEMMFTEKPEQQIISIKIRHLIEEEMERREFKVSMSPQDKKHGHFYTVKKPSREVAGPYNPSKTKAIALVAYRALEGKV